MRERDGGERTRERSGIEESEAEELKELQEALQIAQVVGTETTEFR